MQTFTTFCIALFFTSKRKRRKCIFGRASIGFGRILQQRPNKSLPYKYPHTLMNALCYHPKKSDIRNFSSCEKIFFLRFCAIHIRKFERLTIISYLFSYNTFENTSQYKHQNKDRQLHYIPTTQHEKNVWNLKSSNILTYLRMWFRIFKRKNQHSGTSKKCWITFILEVKEANGSLKDHKPPTFL